MSESEARDNASESESTRVNASPRSAVTSGRKLLIRSEAKEKGKEHKR
jgi:hypothetical protein